MEEQRRSLPDTIDDVLYFIENRVSPIIDIKGTWFQFVIIRKEGGEVIGDAGIHFPDSGKNGTGIGCTIDKNYQRFGFATEAMAEIIKLIFTDLKKNRVIASIDPGNFSSIKLAGKLGLRLESHHKKSIFLNGE